MNSQGYGNRNWVVAFGNGQGGFSRFTQGSTGFRVATSELADLNGDGRADLVTVESKSQRTWVKGQDLNVSIHPGSAQGFVSQQVIQVSSAFSGSDLLLRDVDSDGRLDLSVVTTSGSLINLLRQP